MRLVRVICHLRDLIRVHPSTISSDNGADQSRIGFDRLVEAIDRVAVGARDEMAVDVNSRLNRGVPELLLHGVERLAILEKQARERVASGE